MLSETTWIAGAFAAGLVITLVLAAFFTPGSWWKRPNVRALAILVAGTWAFGSLLLGLVPMPAMAAAPSTLAAEPPTFAMTAIRPASRTAGRSYQVFEDLNLRAASGVNARRVAVVPVGAVVTATGVREGDWWEVSAKVGGKRVTGWVSSLWLRRADEQRG